MLQIKVVNTIAERHTWPLGGWSSGFVVAASSQSQYLDFILDFHMNVLHGDGVMGDQISPFAALVLMQTILRIPALKLFSCCFSGLIHQHVSPNPMHMQPVQCKRGREKIHSSGRFEETGMPTFHSSDRSALGNVPEGPWLIARSGGAHRPAYLSGSQP